MSNTYTQMHFQFVFAVQNRMSIIQSSWKDRLHQYITGIVRNQKHKPIIINGMPDHLHLVVGMRPNQSVSDLLRIMKKDSSTWINDNRFIRGDFKWQEGFEGFTYSKSELPALVEYVKNQEAHHQKKSFLEEYRELLGKFEITFDDKYLFHAIEEE